MGDVLCKWRQASTWTIVELVGQLPKESMSKFDFRTRMDSSIYGPSYNRTAYQLACQMGLYYIDDEDIYYPRFTEDITEEEAHRYLEHWIWQYYVPNPYTRSFHQGTPCLPVVQTIVRHLEKYPNQTNLVKVCEDIWGEAFGNIDNLKFVINEYSEALKVDAEYRITLDPNYKAIMEKALNRYDKKEFFDTITNSSLATFKIEYPLQQIYYGAPGTGKSYAINKQTEGMGDNVIRTTFHPDSDYSTFVGAYKPTKQVVKLRDSSGHVIKDYNEESGRTEDVTEDRIVYKFVAQAFVRAYTRAWRNFAETPEGEQPQPVFLVIEEINRGNCAQIFGDLFQLLDRNDKGFSDYPIVADSDMRGYLFGAMSQARAGLDENCDNDSRKVYNKNRLDAINALYKRDVMADVLSGNALMLPSNLCIWATMNTSDQSLFPIDSAFKRRWDWKYVPIDTAKEEWTLEVNNKKYDWTDFLEKINVEISNVTHSEDKMLGFFFCRADDDKVISAEKFVSKVLFYLYNDVFKDYGFDRDLFKGADGTLQFRDFYETNGTIKEDVVERFLENLKVEPLEEDADEDEEQDTDEDEA